MNTQQAQIKINLPVILKKQFEKKADKFGVTMSFYIKHLLVREVQEKHPVFYASEKVEKEYQQALKDQKEGKLIRIDDMKKYLDSL